MDSQSCLFPAHTACPSEMEKAHSETYAEGGSTSTCASKIIVAVEGNLKHCPEALKFRNNEQHLSSYVFGQIICLKNSL